MVGGRARAAIKARAERAAELENEARGNLPRDLLLKRKLGVLKLTDKQQKMMTRRSTRPASSCNNAFVVFLDLENLRDDLSGVDINTLKDKVVAFLKRQNPDYHIYKNQLIGVGNIALFREDWKILSSWNGMKVIDIYPRDEKFQFANHFLRRPVSHEKVTDIADDQLEQLMFTHRRNFGDPCKIILVTGDGDFSRPMKVLAKCGARVYLAKPLVCNSILDKSAYRSVDFSDIVRTAIP